MAYKNIKDLLVDATKLPASVEAILPAGAPAISSILVDAADKAPVLPDFPIEIPDLPAPPVLPAMPTPPAAEVPLRRYVTGVEVKPAAPAVITRRKPQFLF